MRYGIVLLLGFLSFSCSKKTTDKMFDPTLNHLEFGNGGGFTGASSSLFLFENGEIFRKSTGDTTYSKVGKIDKKMADQMFSNYNTLGLEELTIDEPGNRYYFIVSNKNGQKHKLLWGKNELTNKGPALFYQILNNMVKQLENQKT